MENAVRLSFIALACLFATSNRLYAGGRGKVDSDGYNVSGIRGVTDERCDIEGIINRYVNKEFFINFLAKSLKPQLAEVKYNYKRKAVEVTLTKHYFEMLCEEQEPNKNTLGTTKFNCKYHKTSIWPSLIDQLEFTFTRTSTTNGCTEQLVSNGAFNKAISWGAGSNALDLNQQVATAFLKPYAGELVAENKKK